MGAATINSEIQAHVSPGCGIVQCLLRCGYYSRVVSDLIIYGMSFSALWRGEQVYTLLARDGEGSRSMVLPR